MEKFQLIYTLNDKRINMKYSRIFGFTLKYTFIALYSISNTFIYNMPSASTYLALQHFIFLHNFTSCICQSKITCVLLQNIVLFIDQIRDFTLVTQINIFSAFFRKTSSLKDSIRLKITKNIFFD